MNYPIQKLGIVLFCLSFTATSLSSQTEEDQTLSPFFLVQSEDESLDQFPLKRTSASVNIVGVIADVTIQQVYKNTGAKTLEAVYTFPASTRAAIYALEMKIGERTIHAEIKEKNQAREEYEQARENGQRASLLEQQRPNVFQMNVANILPGDVIEVNLKYTELLIPEKGVYEFVYPVVVGPRYGGETNSSEPSNQFINSPYLHEKEDAPYDFNLKVHLATGVPIQDITSPSHGLIIAYKTSSQADIDLDKSEGNGGNRDFVLRYKLTGEQIETGMLLYKHGDENFYLAMIQPPERVTDDDIPAREYIFIVDVSGSMNGFPIGISKKLLRNLVVNLKPSDRFNVLLFAGGSKWLNEQSVPATEANIEKAIWVIEREQGGGATNLLRALKRAMALPRAEESLSRSIVIVTDGYVGIEREAFDLIRKNGNKANVFAFGIGSSVNRYLIEGLAHAGQGEPAIITCEQEADQQAEKFRQYINRPVLANIKVNYNQFETYDNEPVSVPDMMAERPIILFGKYKGNADGKIVLTGHSGKGRYRTELDAGMVQPDPRNEAIRYLWARERIRMLDDYSRVDNNADEAKEVTGLGLKYNLMTRYTSFVAIDEKAVVDSAGNYVKVKQPLPLPKGVSNFAVGFDEEVYGFTGMTSSGMALVEDDVMIEPESNLINTELDGEKNDLAIKYISDNLIENLQKCLNGNVNFPDEIEVTVGIDGKVVSINFQGIDLSRQMKDCIRREIEKLDFNLLGVHRNWKFQILN